MGGWDGLSGKAFAMEDWWPELIFRTHIKVWGDYRTVFSDPPHGVAHVCLHTHHAYTSPHIRIQINSRASLPPRWQNGAK